MERKELNVLSNIKTNEDQYGWKELNCFYKPLAIIFNSFESHYFVDFLLLLGYSITFNMGNSFSYLTKKRDSIFEEFFIYYNSNLESLFHIQIINEKQDDYDSFVSSIINHIDNREPVLVPVDLFHIYYDDQYERKHAPHYIIIKGYDAKRKLFYILDTLQVNNGQDAVYYNFKITFHMLWSANISRLIWSFHKAGELPSHRKLMTRLSDYIKTFEANASIDMDINHLSDDNYQLLDTKEYVVKCNMRNIYYDMIKVVLSDINVNYDMMNEQIKEILTQWDFIKANVLYKIKKQDFNLFVEIQQSEKTFSMELELQRNIRKLLDDNISSIIVSEETGYIKNMENAIINIDNNNNILIEHINTKIANLYQPTDEAPQVLYRVKEEEFVFHAEMEMWNLGDDSYQSGIELKELSGDRYLFGIKKNESLTLICHDRNYKREIPFSESKVKLRISKSKENVSFSYMNHDRWVTLYDYNITHRIEFIGVFSSTWKAINHKVRFNNVGFC